MARNYGIDLGTTNTVVCKFEFLKAMEFAELSEIPIVYPSDKTHGYYNVNNNTSLPSIVFLEKDLSSPGQYIHYVGEVAERLSILPENTNKDLFINTKRLMSKVQDLGHGVKARDVAKDLYEVCFHSIKDRTVKGKISSTQSFCVTRPAAYNPFATVATMDVIKEFGFNNVSSIEEPVAALLNYLYTLLKNEDNEKEILDIQKRNGGHLTFGIVDIGGGTTDVKIQKFSIKGSREIEGDDFATGYIITFDNEEIDGKQSLSNPYEAFGGLDFDRLAAKYILQKLNIKLQAIYNKSLDEFPKNQKSNLQYKAMYEAKNFKEHMNGVHVGIWSVPKEYIETTSDVKIEWSEDEYIKWVDPLCYDEDRGSNIDIHKLSVYSIIENTLKRTNYSANELDCLYITGGMSCYRPIREMLTREYGDKVRVKFSDSPLTDIARGAALYNTYFQINVPLVTLNEGIWLDNPCGEPIMIANTGHRLPYEGDIVNKIVMTNPVEMHISILSGVSIYDSNMRIIKRLCARRLPITKIGTPVDIHFYITEEPRISLTFLIRQAEKTYEIPIDADEYDLKIE